VRVWLLPYPPRGAMTKAEHLQWARARAIEYLDKGDAHQAFSSFASDLQKHEETLTPQARELIARAQGLLILRAPEGVHAMRGAIDAIAKLL
jgi:hypothetical protein